MNRRLVVRELLADRGDLLCVSGLGASTWDVAAVGGHPLDVPLWGAMGGAAMVGLGLALAQPARRVLVLTGDGEQLMGLGSLATIGLQQPANLALVVLDNERYGETGSQPTHTAGPTDLAACARACGIADARTVTDAGELTALRSAIRALSAPLVAVCKIDAAQEALVLPARDGAIIATRFRDALLGPQAAAE